MCAELSTYNRKVTRNFKMVQRVLKIFLVVSLLHVLFFWYIFTRSKESDFIYYDIEYDTKDIEKEWIMLEDPSTTPSPDYPDEYDAHERDE